MDKGKILVTGIGGNVGQGIIRNIRKSYPDISVIGCNIIEFSAGNHLCDAFYQVPYAWEKNYIDSITEIVKKENIQLIVPSTDFEVYYLSNHQASINTKIAVSGPLSSEAYLDKYLTFRHHQQFDIPFAESYLPSFYDGRFKDFILKPRKGRGSRGLYINPENWRTFSDDEYVVQELHKGEEITTAFYVNKNNELHGFITMVRSLDNGATSQCRVTFEYDRLVEPILKSMIKHGDIKGSANLQSIATKEGRILPFEINCRISGTNSIRSNFGFDDVKYTIDEYLFNKQPEVPSIINGVAVRILMDVIYPQKQDFGECLDNKSDFFIF